MAGKLLVGVWDSPDGLLEAARAARRAGLPVHDAFTPFPVHGMDEALGLGRSWLSKACLAFALTGLSCAFGFEYWVSVFDWPMNVGGKSFSASPALLPVAFELTVLFAGLGTVGTFFVSRRLTPVRPPKAPGLGATDDRFLLALKLDGDGRAAMERFLKDHGASAVLESGGAR